MKLIKLATAIALATALSTTAMAGGVARLRRLGKTFGKRFRGFAVESFYSAAPIACGPYAARVRLQPADATLPDLPSRCEPLPPAEDAGTFAAHFDRFADAKVLLLGAGGVRDQLDTTNDHDSINPYINAGGGLLIALSDRFTFRAEGRWLADCAPGETGHLLINGPGKYPDYNFYRHAGMSIAGKAKGEAANESAPIDLKSLLP